MISRCHSLGRRTLFPTVVALGLMLVRPAVAQHSDTLELKDGRLLTGTYMGGSQNTIRFKAGDQMIVPFWDDTTPCTAKQIPAKR